MADGLSPQDIQDLQEIAKHLPAGDPRVAKVNLLLNSQPTQFEQDRTPDAKTGGWWNAVKSNISMPGGQNPYPGMGIEQKVAAANQSVEQDNARKAAGYGTWYRDLAPVAQSVGANVTGMEAAAAHGDTGGVLGHGTIPVATAVLPLAAEAAVRGIPAAANSASAVLDSRIGQSAKVIARPAFQAARNAVADIPIVRGVVKGAALAKDVPAQLLEIWQKGQLPEQVLSGEEGSLPVTTPSDVPLEHVPADKATVIPPEVANLYKLRGYADNMEDAGIRQAMEEDLNRQGNLGNAEERAKILAERQAAGLDIPKWQRSAQFKAQQILDQAQQQAQSLIEQARQKGERGLMASVPRNPAAEAAAEEIAKQAPTMSTAEKLSATQNLEELLRQSIERAQAAKAKAKK